MRAGAEVAFGDRFRRVDGEVVEETKARLRVWPGDVVSFDEEVVRKAETAGEAGHQFLGDGLRLVHECQGCLFELGEVVGGYPAVGHIAAPLDLIRPVMGSVMDLVMRYMDTHSFMSGVPVEGRTWAFFSQPTFLGDHGAVALTLSGRAKKFAEVENMFSMVGMEMPWLIKQKKPSFSAA